MGGCQEEGGGVNIKSFTDVANDKELIIKRLFARSDSLSMDWRQERSTCFGPSPSAKQETASTPTSQNPFSSRLPFVSAPVRRVLQLRLQWHNMIPQTEKGDHSTCVRRTLTEEREEQIEIISLVCGENKSVNVGVGFSHFLYVREQHKTSHRTKTTSGFGGRCVILRRLVGY